MHLTPVLCVIIGLAVLSMTAPQPAELTNGTSIEIFRHSDFLLNDDGSVDLHMLSSHVASVHTKIIRGFENIERNTGMRSPLSLKQIKKRTNSVRLSPLSDLVHPLWQGTVQFGSPNPRVFFVVFDTASGDLFVPSFSCDETCRGHSRWKPWFSRTARNVEEPCHIAYSDGGVVSGDLYTDQVAISPLDLTATEQTICVAKSYPPAYQSPRFAADGVMGMGFQPLSSYGASTVFETLASQGRVTNPIFSFKFSLPYGELLLGGMNSALYTGTPTFVPVILKGFWLVNMDNIIVSGVALTLVVASDVPAIIDTASIVMVGPPSHVEQIQYYLGGVSMGDGFYSVPCNSRSTIGLTFAGKTFPIPYPLLNLGSGTPTTSSCVSSIVGWDLVPGRDVWIVGLPFLQSVYSTFSLGDAGSDPQVGFATLA